MRLGEHDLGKSDGQHQDYDVCYIDKHEKYLDSLSVNDISIVTLTKDVKFNGKMIFFLFSTILHLFQ